MPCYDHQMATPVGVTKNSKTQYRFRGRTSRKDLRFLAFQPDTIFLPCRQCIGCRLEKSRQWATRLMHETKFHEKACFLTLTYDEANEPENRSLNKSHLATFFDSLRARMSYYGKEKIKYFRVGEYGDLRGRPHYHAIVYGPFGVSTPDPDRNAEEPARSGEPQYSHSDIAAVWPHGLHRFSEVTFESAAYVARYHLKKILGANASSHYGMRIPEFQSCSNGLGKQHVDAWLSDIYPGDQVVLPGRGAFLPPPYYDRLLEKTDPVLFQKVKEARREAHEKMTTSDMYEHVLERQREAAVRKLVTDATLIRSL